MREVNIYTASGIRSPRKTKGKVGYVLEYRTSKGEATLSKVLILLDATANLSELIVMLEALRRIREKCHLTLFTESEYVAAGLAELPNWRKNGFITSRNTPVAHHEKWREAAEILDTQSISVQVKKEHKYKAWLMNEVTRKE